MKIDFEKIKKEIKINNILGIYYEYSLILESLVKIFERNLYNNKSSILREAISIRKVFYNLCKDFMNSLHNYNRDESLAIINNLENELNEVEDF